MARRHRPLFPLPCPRRNRYAPSSSSQSPLSSVSAWRRKLRPLPCSSSPNRTRYAGLRFGTAASPPYPGDFMQSPLSSVSRLAAKTAPASLLLLSKSDPLRGAPVWTAASPPYLGKSYRSCADSGQTEAGPAPAPCRSGVRLLGLVTPSPARGSPRRRCPQ